MQRTADPTTLEVTAPFEVFPHDADMGVRGRGADPAEAFGNAALALTSVITDPAAVAATTSLEVHVHAPDLEVLLVDWLNEIIYEMVTRGMVFGRFDVEIAGPATPSGGGGWALHGRLHGEPIDSARHQPAVEIKGATYTALKVAPQGNGWCAQCVVDV